MILTKEQQKEFSELSKPLMKFLNNNFHPHITVIVTPTSAELLEESCGTGQILDFVKD